MVKIFFEQDDKEENDKEENDKEDSKELNSWYKKVKPELLKKIYSRYQSLTNDDFKKILKLIKDNDDYTKKLTMKYYFFDKKRKIALINNKIMKNEQTKMDLMKILYEIHYNGGGQIKLKNIPDEILSEAQSEYYGDKDKNYYGKRLEIL